VIPISSIRRYLPALLGVIAIAACQQTPINPPASNQTDCRTISHKLGETEICSQPQRIAVLGPFILEPLLALGTQPIAFAELATWHQGDYDNPSYQIPYLGQYVTRPLINIGSIKNPLNGKHSSNGCRFDVC